MFSHFLDQKEQKNNWYKFGSHTWCYKPHPNVEVKLQTHTHSNQMDFHLSYIPSTHLQVDAEIEVARENKKEQDSKEAETEVSKSQIPKCF